LSSFGSGVITNSAVRIHKAGQHLRFAPGHGTRLVVGHGDQVWTFAVHGTDITIEDLHIEGFRNPNRNDSRAALHIGQRFNSGATSGSVQENIKIIRPKFHDCDAAISGAWSMWGGVKYAPTNTQIIDPWITSCYYQGIVALSAEMRILGGSVHMTGDPGNVGFPCAVRVTIADGFFMDGAKIYMDMARNAFIFATGGQNSPNDVSGSTDIFGDDERCKIINVDVYKGGFAAFGTGPSLDRVFENCNHYGDMNATGEGVPFNFEEHFNVPRFGVTEFRNCNFYGSSAVLTADPGNHGKLKFVNTNWYGNRFAGPGSAHENAIKINNGAGNDAKGDPTIGFTDVEFDRCGFYFRQSSYFIFFKVENTAANTRFRIRNCDVPQGITNMIADTTGGTGVLVETGNTPFTPAFVNQMLSVVASNPRGKETSPGIQGRTGV
jgi:hypothetical protein